VAGTSDDELERMLSALQPAMGDVEYTFKHALTLEVGYNSVLIERRRLLRERAAQAIEALFADRQISTRYIEGQNLSIRMVCVDSAVDHFYSVANIWEIGDIVDVLEFREAKKYWMTRHGLHCLLRLAE
jgi:predicted ATPase